MEPGFNTPRSGPEQTPSLPPVSPEITTPGNGERGVFEQEPQRIEQEPLPQAQAGVVPDPSTIAAPVLPQPATDDTQDATAVLTSVPDVAADDDVIEKEWVDKAKHIITETADDPYRREQAVGQLQREYLRKRYGKEVGAAE